MKMLRFAPLLIGVLCASASGQLIRYVDDDAPFAGDGTSWASAFKYLQDALDEAQINASIDEIRVAQGTYTPDLDENGGHIAGSRSESFRMFNGLTVRGGYAGFGAPNPDAHDPMAYVTVLTGDLAADDLPGFVNNAENSYHVVDATGVDATSRLEGCTITAGHANGTSADDKFGAGVFAPNSSISMSGCVIIENWSESGATGLHMTNGDATVQDCVFEGNNISLGDGAAAYPQNSTVLFHRCTFYRNAEAGHPAAAVTTFQCDVTFEGCGFFGNNTPANCDEAPGSATFVNCVMSENSVFLSSDDITMDIINCSIIGSGSQPVYVRDGTLNISNTILWGNVDNSIGMKNATVNETAVLYSSPAFVDADGPDDIPGTPDDDLRLLPTSIAIDGGVSTELPTGPLSAADYFGARRIFDGDADGLATVDIGASEFGAPTTGSVLYVNDDAGGGANGSSWAEAYLHLQDALAVAAALPTLIDEIWVAEGVYYPDRNSAFPGGTGDRTATFDIPDGLALRGGFAGTESDPSERVIGDHQSVLCGDLFQDDLLDVSGDLIPATIVDNSFTVVRGLAGVTCTLDGLTIERGFSNGGIEEHERGGGLYFDGASLLLRDCTFALNTSASDEGGAVFITVQAVTADVVGCTFVRNTAWTFGGAIFCGGASSFVRVWNSGFHENKIDSTSSQGENRGGAISVTFSSQPGQFITGCTFTGNSAQIGGAVYTFCAVGATATITSCSFDANSASQSGGSIHSQLGTVVVRNSSFGAFSSPDGIDIRVRNNADLNIDYSVIAGGPSALQVDPTGVLTVGSGVVYADPQYLDPLGADGLAGTRDDDLSLSPSSPAVDAGSNIALPLDVFDFDNDGDVFESISLDVSGNPRRTDVAGVADTGVGPAPVVDIGSLEVPACGTCPGERFWQNQAGGVFEIPANWFPGVPGIANAAVFDIDASFVVTLQNNVLNDQLEVRAGDVTLDLGGWEFELESAVETPVIVGDEGVAGLNVVGGLLVSNSGIVGRNAGSFGSLGFDGSSAGWSVDDGIEVGFLGQGLLTVSGGAIVDALDVGQGSLPGSTGDITVTGPGSLLDALFLVTVENGTLDVNTGGTVAAGIGFFGGVVLFENGTLTGDGTVVGNVVNLGDIVPRSGAIPGTMSITGELLQIGTEASGDGRVGSLTFDIAGTTPGEFDTLSVGGIADLAGALVVEFDASYDPQLSDTVDLITASNVVNQFDVAYFRGFYTGVSDTRFMRLNYGAVASAPQGLFGPAAGVSIIVDTLGGNPELQSPQDFTTTNTPAAAAVGDLNGDMLDDLVVVVPSATPATNGDLVIFTNAGSTLGVWNGFTQTTVAVGVDPTGVDIGNIDGVNGLDVVVSNAGDDNVHVLLNDGFGLPVFDTAYAMTESPRDVMAIDLDNDGLDDVAAIGDTPGAPPDSPGQLSARVNNGVGVLGAAISVATGIRPVFFADGEMDGDKWEDILVANEADASVSLYRNPGDPGTGWTGFAPREDHDVQAGPIWVSIGDLDNDSDLDVLVANRDSDSMSVLRNDGAGLFGPASNIPVGESPRSIALADLDEDSCNDLDVAVVVDDDSAQRVIRILRNDTLEQTSCVPSGTTSIALTQTEDLASGAVPVIVTSGEFDNANGPDLVAVNEDTGAPPPGNGPVPPGEVEVLLGAAPLPPPCDGDVNGDGEVNVNDVGYVIFRLGDTGVPGAVDGDANADGTVDAGDISYVIFRLGGQCP